MRDVHRDQAQAGDRLIVSAEAYLPAGEDSIAALRAAAQHCEGCDFYERATQTVFGEERVRTPLLMLVREQPGDVEDRTGHPFGGPAGELLNEALDAVGIDGRTIYVTDAVKRFKWESRGSCVFTRIRQPERWRTAVHGCWQRSLPSDRRCCSVSGQQRLAPSWGHRSKSRSTGAKCKGGPSGSQSSRPCTPHRSCAFVMRRSGVLPSITSSTIFALLLPIQGDCGTRTAGKHTTCPPRPRDNDPRALTKRRPQMVDSNPTTPIAPTRYRTPTAMTPDLSRATPGSWPATGYSPLG